MKQNITDVASAMSIISQLKPKHYNFRQDGNYKLMNLPKGQHYGLLAQNVEKIMPAAVKAANFRVDDAAPDVPSGDANYLLTQTVAKQKTGEVINFKTVNYSEFIPVIIKGMQEQQSTIAAEQQTIEALNNIVAKQQEQINQLLALNKLAVTTINGSTLIQNAPNPFSSSTFISYSLPQTYSSAQLSLRIKAAAL